MMTFPPTNAYFLKLFGDPLPPGTLRTCPTCGREYSIGIFVVE
jgi:hypothetical protein